LDLIDFRTGWTSYLSTMAVGEAREFTIDDEVIELELCPIVRREKDESYHNGTWTPETLGMQCGEQPDFAR
jgi:hypothetical protein